MAGSEPVDFHLTDRRGAYDFVTRALRRLNYVGLTKADKGVVRRFVAKVTGLSRAQSTRLIGQYQRTGHIRDRRYGATRPFERRYTAADIRLLAEVDETLGGLCGPTTRRVMRRQYEVFGDERFERLASQHTAAGRSPPRWRCGARFRSARPGRRRARRPRHEPRSRGGRVRAPAHLLIRTSDRPSTPAHRRGARWEQRGRVHSRGRAARSIGTTRFCGKFTQPGSTRKTPRCRRRTPPPGRAPAGRRRAASEGQAQGPSAVSGASTTPSGRV